MSSESFCGVTGGQWKDMPARYFDAMQFVTQNNVTARRSPLHRAVGCLKSIGCLAEHFGYRLLCPVDDLVRFLACQAKRRREAQNVALRHGASDDAEP